MTPIPEISKVLLVIAQLGLYKPFAGKVSEVKMHN